VIDKRGSAERNLKEMTTGSRLLTLTFEGEGQSRISAMKVPVNRLSE
jgi:hypothetical protein